MNFWLILQTVKFLLPSISSIFAHIKLSSAFSRPTWIFSFSPCMAACIVEIYSHSCHIKRKLKGTRNERKYAMIAMWKSRVWAVHRSIMYMHMYRYVREIKSRIIKPFYFYLMFIVNRHPYTYNVEIFVCTHIRMERLLCIGANIERQCHNVARRHKKIAD